MRLFMGLSACLTLVLAAGCGGREPAAPEDAAPETVADPVVAAWLELPEAGYERLDAGRATQLAAELNARGPDGLDPLFDIMADPEGDPVAKVLTVISLTPFVRPEMAPRLKELTAPGNEATTRTCATHLLGLLSGAPEVNAQLRELAEDDDARVRATATLVLSQMGDEDARERLPEMWSHPETTARDRQQIVLVLPEGDHAFLPVFEEAALDLELDQFARQRAVTVLGRIGEESAKEVLEAVADTDPDSGIRDLAGSALVALRVRLAGPDATSDDLEGITIIDVPAGAIPQITAPGEAPPAIGPEDIPAPPEP